MATDRLNMLLAALADPKVSVQWNATRELARLGREATAAVPTLERIAVGSDATACVWARYGLAVIVGTTEEHIPFLINALADRRVFPGMAATAIAGIGAPAAAAAPMLIESMSSDRPDDRWSAIWALGQIGVGSSEVIDALSSALDSADEKERWYAAWALGEFGRLARPAAGRLTLLLYDFDDDVRGYSARALAAIGDPVDQETLVTLQEMLEDENNAIREAAAVAIAACS